MAGGEMSFRRPLAAAATLALVGCAVHPGGGFSATEVTIADPRDAPVLALAITELVAAKEGPGPDPIVLQPAGLDDPVARDLKTDLLSRGYQVTQGAGPANRVLRYEIGPFGRSTLLRVSLNGGDAAKLFARSKDGALVAISPFTSRGPGEAL